MKIIHYSLGFAPYRTGGLTKFCLDLMINQKNQGDTVALLWPGRIKIFGNKVGIKESEDTLTGIKSYELINPNPVPLDEGITNIDSFINSVDVEFYKRWFKDKKPDILHIHTLMGIHKELIIAAKECGVRTIFTTHDYYGLCPKVTLFHNGKVCDNDYECTQCVECNESALSLKKIMIMQSSVYRNLKTTKVVELLRHRHRRKFFEENNVEDKSEKKQISKSISAKDYMKLRQYYVQILEMIDIIHFNSSVTKNIYERFIKPKSSRLINISNSSIKNRRIIKRFDNENLRILYLSPTKPYKGFNILKNSLDQLWEEGHRNFIIDIFDGVNDVAPYMNINEGFNHKQLDSIFNEADVLIAPSLWWETFGFTVIEALSYGVPVIVTKNVGAKDIVGDGGYIIDGSVEAIKKVIKEILVDRSILENMNKFIANIDIMTQEDMVKEIYNIYIER